MPRLKNLRLLLVAGGLAALAACQTPPPPPPPPAPVVQQQYTPRAPTPPFGASNLSIVPMLRVDGLRDTINRDLGPLETLWHVRAALNVAALSCTGPLYERLVDDYNAFISNNSASLRNANNAIIRKFQRETGSGYKTEHDRHQTQLYNYWSFSPLRRPFCDQAVQISQRAMRNRLCRNWKSRSPISISLMKNTNAIFRRGRFNMGSLRPTSYRQPPSLGSQSLIMSSLLQADEPIQNC